MVLPANIETLEDLIKEHMAIAKDLFKEYGDVGAMCIGYTKNSRVLIPIEFHTSDEKEALLRIVTMVFAVHDVNRYTIGHEAWMLEGPPDQVNAEYDRLKKEGLMIADSPMRVEALVCTATSRFKSLALMSMIKEDRSLVDYENDFDFTTAGGRFTELLPPRRSFR